MDGQDNEGDHGGTTTPSRSDVDHNSSLSQQLNHRERPDAIRASADDNVCTNSTQNQAINQGAEAHVGSNTTKPFTSAGTNTSTSTGYEPSSTSGVSWSRAG